uniref:MADS-box domain-containing protein n=1 Tax=Oryza punctata TaxID=4537 RepID=A0A0E0JSM3_ORYPU
MPPDGCGEATPVTAVAVDPRHEQRRVVLETRKEKLVRKASELATRCRVPVALSCQAFGGGCEPLRWPSMEEAREINKRYKALPENDRRKHTVGDAADLANQAAAAKQQADPAGGESARAAERAAAFGAMPEEELRELLRSIDVSLAAASHMIQKAAEEAEQKHSLQRAHADMNTLMVDSSDAMLPNAAPMDMRDNPVASEDAVLECSQKLMRLRRSLENLQDPIRWFEEKREPVICPQKKPKPCTAPPPPASGGVPYDDKYINLGGYMIERDRFDAIWREHAIPPQCLQPQSLPDDDGEPLRLWSFDDGETSSIKRLRGEDQSSLDTCRRAVLERRKEILARKASELATRCDVPVAVICPGVGAGGEPTWWPSKEEAWAIATRYKALPEKDRRKHSVDDASYCENQAAAKQGGGGELAMATQEDGIAAMTDEELRELLRSIDVSLAAASNTIQKAADEAEQKLSLERACALMVDSSQDAAPMSDMGKKPKPCTAAPPPASGSGFAYDGEYINLGGYMIERDRFEAIWREHAIPPLQSLQPESLPDDDDGEPLRLWSFDDGETVVI